MTKEKTVNQRIKERASKRTQIGKIMKRKAKQELEQVRVSKGADQVLKASFAPLIKEMRKGKKEEKKTLEPIDYSIPGDEEAAEAVDEAIELLEEGEGEKVETTDDLTEISPVVSIKDKMDISKGKESTLEETSEEIIDRLIEKEEGSILEGIVDDQIGKAFEEVAKEAEEVKGRERTKELVEEGKAKKEAEEKAKKEAEEKAKKDAEERFGERSAREKAEEEVEKKKAKEKARKESEERFGERSAREREEEKKHEDRWKIILANNKSAFTKKKNDAEKRKPADWKLEKYATKKGDSKFEGIALGVINEAYEQFNAKKPFAQFLPKQSGSGITPTDDILSEEEVEKITNLIERNIGSLRAGNTSKKAIKEIVDSLELLNETGLITKEERLARLKSLKQIIQKKSNK